MLASTHAAIHKIYCMSSKKFNIYGHSVIFTIWIHQSLHKLDPILKYCFDMSSLNYNLAKFPQISFMVNYYLFK